MRHQTALGVSHQMMAAEGVNLVDLRTHLLDDHRVSVEGANTKAQLGKLHLLAHTVEAYPELKALLTNALKEVPKT